MEWKEAAGTFFAPNSTSAFAPHLGASLTALVCASEPEEWSYEPTGIIGELLCIATVGKCLYYSAKCAAPCPMLEPTSLLICLAKKASACNKAVTWCAKANRCIFGEEPLPPEIDPVPVPMDLEPTPSCRSRCNSIYSRNWCGGCSKISGRLCRSVLDIGMIDCGQGCDTNPDAWKTFMCQMCAQNNHLSCGVHEDCRHKPYSDCLDPHNLPRMN